eukprot:GHVR01062741.1.p1 GENE.GHVR01062741.1~~GHVR01062741.1.p1  ORF type:complete len:138 (-),score=7.85 GHVR01062741.1:514-927(-)
MTQFSPIQFQPKSFESWEINFNVATKVRRQWMLLSSQRSEGELQSAIDATLWSELLTAVSNTQEALAVLHTLVEAKQNVTDGLNALKERYKKTDAQRKAQAMTSLESFTFETGESLFCGIERFKFLMERAENLEVYA